MITHQLYSIYCTSRFQNKIKEVCNKRCPLYSEADKFQLKTVLLNFNATKQKWKRKMKLRESLTRNKNVIS